MNISIRPKNSKKDIKGSKAVKSKKGVVNNLLNKLKQFKKIAILGSLLLATSLGYNFYQYKQINEYRSNPNKSMEDQRSDVASRVEKVYKTPTYKETVDGKEIIKDDTPRIYALTEDDKSKLTGQVFFDNAEVGDYVVVFPKTKNALIFRKSSNQVVNSGPLALNDDQQATKLSIKIFGGTGDRDAVATKIDVAFPGSTSITKSDVVGEISTTVVVDVSGNNAAAAKQIAEKLGNAVVGGVPQGQATPTDTQIAIYASNKR